MEILVTALRRPGVLVVDEFQRLPGTAVDLVAAASVESEAGLVLCGSSLSLVRRVFEPRSPLLGLLEAFRVDLASVADTVASLAEAGLEPRQAVLWATLARDPWLLRHLEPRGLPWKALGSRIHGLVAAARGLVGEVFEEEERSLTRLYDAVLTLLAQGYWRSSDIAARLYEAGLVSSPSPSSVTGVLAVLEQMGLAERIPLWRSRRARTYYRHRSSLLAILYSVAETVEEIGAAPPPEALAAKMGVELAFNVAELLAARKRLARGYSVQPGGRDVDVVLLDRHGRARWGYEVKAGKATSREAEEAAAWIKSLGIPHAGLVALLGLQGRTPGVLDEVLDAEQLVEEARRLSEEARRLAEKGSHPPAP